MSEEERVRAPFEYDQSNIFKDLVFSWIFPLINFYHKNPATEHTIFELPKRFEYQDDLKKLKSGWRKIKKLPKPNIFNAVWPIFKKRFIIGVLPGTISYNCTLVNSVMLLYITNYINGKSDVIVPYVVIYGLSVLSNMIAINYSFRSLLLLVAKLKACLTEIVFEKALKTYYGEISQGSQSGKLTSLISADIEFLEGISFMPLVFCMPLILIGAGILLWFNLGVAGVIGLLVTIFHLPLILYFGKCLGKSLLLLETQE